MESKNYAEVLIDGEIYTLEGEEEEGYLQRVASYIHEETEGLHETEPGLPGHHGGVEHRRRLF